jgi:hypothetical protein
MGRFTVERRQVLAAGGIALDPDEGIWGPQALSLEKTPRRRKRRERGTVYHSVDRSADTSIAAAALAPVVEAPAAAADVHPADVALDAMEQLMYRTGDSARDVIEPVPVPREDLL